MKNHYYPASFLGKNFSNDLINQNKRHRETVLDIFCIAEELDKKSKVANFKLDKRRAENIFFNEFVYEETEDKISVWHIEKDVTDFFDEINKTNKKISNILPNSNLIKIKKFFALQCTRAPFYIKEAILLFNKNRFIHNINNDLNDFSSIENPQNFKLFLDLYNLLYLNNYSNFYDKISDKNYQLLAYQNYDKDLFLSDISCAEIWAERWGVLSLLNFQKNIINELLNDYSGMVDYSYIENLMKTTYWLVAGKNTILYLYKSNKEFDQEILEYISKRLDQINFFNTTSILYASKFLVIPDYTKNEVFLKNFIKGYPNLPFDRLKNYYNYDYLENSFNRYKRYQKLNDI